MSILKVFNKGADGPRELVFDAESTGILVSEGHRLVEVALIEMVGQRPTGREFHAIINPDRDIPAEVVKIHGISNEEVKDKPFFGEIAKDLREFIGNDPVIITCRTTADGYTLDIAQLNMEFQKAGQPEVPEEQWVNVRRWSEAMFGDKSATLDKVLDRYGVSRKERDDNGHGAVLDARLLSEVYPKLLKDYMNYSARHPAPAAKDKKPGPKS
ncbi:MAG: DNA polymerase III subunit epsilon [Alphaproteobacteria bacterium]|nr:DNA polymerase III subunit epsilon [Alphaproteobacteria bacterium]